MLISQNQQKLPSTDDDVLLANRFSNYFETKIDNIRKGFKINVTANDQPPLNQYTTLHQFRLASSEEIIELITSYSNTSANLYKGRNKGATNSLRNVYDVSMYNSIMLHCALFTRTIQCSADMCVYDSCGNQLFVSYQYYACTILCYLHIYSGITVQVQKSCKSSIRHNILDHYFHCIITAYVFQNIIHVTGLKCLNDILITYLVHRIIINSSYISSCTNSYKNICKCTFFGPNQYFKMMYYINKQLGPFFSDICPLHMYSIHLLNNLNDISFCCKCEITFMFTFTSSHFYLHSYIHAHSYFDLLQICCGGNFLNTHEQLTYITLSDK